MSSLAGGFFERAATADAINPGYFEPGLKIYAINAE